MQGCLLLTRPRSVTPTRNRRNTAQQRAIRDAIRNAEGPLSTGEIHEIATKDSPGLGIRTVYRVVGRLLEDGEITTVVMPGRADRYELTEIAASHHHHFHCKRCDRLFDVQGCPGHLERMVPDGFILDGHEITLNGLCARCAG